MNKSHKQILLFLISNLILTSSYASFDRSLFYRASSFWGEPRFERNFLSTLQIQLSGGSTECGRNKQREKTNILSIYGPENIPLLTQNICPSLKEDVRSCLKQCNNNTIALQGVFNIFEVNFNYYQNSCNGIFLHFHLPFMHLQLHPCSYKEHIDQLKHTSLGFLERILTHLNICPLPAHKTDIGDITLFIGKTINYEQTTHLDFIDFTIQAGVLFPTGKKKNEHCLFDLPYGYNGHWGIPLCVDLAFGAFDSVTFGLHADSVFFKNKTACRRMNTLCNPTGFIKVAEGCTTVKSGPVWRVGTYIKADHICSGLSAIIAFTHEQKEKDILCPNNAPFIEKIVNHNEQLQKWSRTLFQCALEYDFAQEEHLIGPQIAILYSRHLTGKRIFETNIAAGLLAFNIAWCF